MASPIKTKDFVTLRKRERPNGRIALFLDIIKDGKRHFEYLKLYLIPEKTKADKAANKDTMRLAEAIKAQRVVEMQSSKFGFDETDTSKVLFYDFIESLINRKAGTTKTSWQNCMAHLLRYEPTVQLLSRVSHPNGCKGSATTST